MEEVIVTTQDKLNFDELEVLVELEDGTTIYTDGKRKIMTSATNDLVVGLAS